MWLFLPFGFFSIVANEDRKHPDELIVRARTKHDLETFAMRMTESGDFSELPAIHETPNRDYAFRLFAPRRAVEQTLSTFVLDELVYPNFKDEVALPRNSGPERARLYHDVWSILRAALQPSSVVDAIRRSTRARRK